MSTDTKAKHKQADVLQRFADPWALLNADADDLRRAASGYPQEEVEDLVELLASLRALMRMAYVANPEYVPVGLVDRKEYSRKVMELYGTVATATMRYGLAELDGCAVEPGAVTVSTQEHPEPVVIPAPSSTALFDALHKPLLWLVRMLEQEDPPLLYKCEYCGRIGEAQRSDKRWCSDRCRMRVARGG